MAAQPDRRVARPRLMPHPVIVPDEQRLLADLIADRGVAAHGCVSLVTVAADRSAPRIEKAAPDGNGGSEKAEGSVASREGQDQAVISLKWVAAGRVRAVSGREPMICPMIRRLDAPIGH
ncbi:hypothetical protein GCM10009560_60120 [Nonomuraea longicatena]|uniref:Uncharacterized protein n=1 Tax=Nonomuraea longicatena TaxID=83682 RepID=A0ABN1QNN4_9ACTN